MSAVPAVRCAAVFRALLWMLGGIVSLSCRQYPATSPDGPGARAAVVRVAPMTRVVEEGASVTLQATVLDAAGRELTSRTVVWAVSDTTLATVSTAGTVVGRRAGTVLVTATVDRVAGSATVTVAAARVGSVTLSLANPTIRPSEATIAVATVRDTHGNVLTGRTVIFASSDPGVASVSGLGVVTGTGAGVATISAVCEGVAARTDVTVTPPSVVAVAIAPVRGTLMAGQTLAITAIPLNARGETVADGSVRFASSDPAVATVSATGVVTAVARGSAAIVATSEAKSATTTVSVLDATDGNWVRLDSDPGDWLGEGVIYTYTAANAMMNAGSRGTEFRATVIGGDSRAWDGRVTLPSALGRLQSGTYRYVRPGSDPAVGSMAWSYGNRGCNTVTGSATIDSVRYVGEMLAALDMRFVQHCDDDRPALRGTVHWRADLAPLPPTLPPGPISPVPSELWTPPTDRVPSSGNWVYAESDSTEWIGQGRAYLYVWPTAGINAAAYRATMGDGFAAVNFFRQGEVWSLSLQAPAGNRVLRPGYYPGVMGYGHHDRTRGGLDVRGLYRSCTALTGWFTIDSVSYRGDTLTALDARFEQHCEGRKPALRGAVRWRLATMLSASAAGLRGSERSDGSRPRNDNRDSVLGRARTGSTTR